jgi:hypothetical protein
MGGAQRRVARWTRIVRGVNTDFADQMSNSQIVIQLLSRLWILQSPSLVVDQSIVASKFSYGAERFDPTEVIRAV